MGLLSEDVTLLFIGIKKKEVTSVLSFPDRDRKPHWRRKVSRQTVVRRRGRRYSISLKVGGGFKIYNNESFWTGLPGEGPRTGEEY